MCARVTPPEHQELLTPQGEEYEEYKLEATAPSNGVNTHRRSVRQVIAGILKWT